MHAHVRPQKASARKRRRRIETLLYIERHEDGVPHTYTIPHTHTSPHARDNHPRGHICDAIWVGCIDAIRRRRVEGDYAKVGDSKKGGIGEKKEGGESRLWFERRGERRVEGGRAVGRMGGEEGQSLVGTQINSQMP
jgi:hypothetical protein